jgi:hypothetical protein
MHGHKKYAPRRSRIIGSDDAATGEDWCCHRHHIRRLTMPTATDERSLDTYKDRPNSGRWRLAPYVFLIALMFLAVFAQNQPIEVSILPTGPLPAINIP